MGDVSTRLQAGIATGALDEDAAQIAAAAALDELLVDLEETPRAGLISRILGRDDTPLGLYMWGGVGRGKSMLMDWFFRAAPVANKRRVHFHAFMIETHARINHWRKLSESARKTSDYYVRGAGDDPIAPVAKQIAKEARLLCFDEFHVTDITDAMILSRLFAQIWERGVVVVATSNRPPDDLYKNGLNRPLFEPFIEMMPQHLKIHEFVGALDHRLRQLTAAPVFHCPLGKEADTAMDAAWARLIGAAKTRASDVHVQGRTLAFPVTAKGVLRTDFPSLCAATLGPADYLAIAQEFQTLILENVPQMGPENRNEAKRFVTLIDALYETRTKLVMSAAVQPDKLYEGGTGAFEFERTASRLVEMRSEDYLGAARDVEVGV